MSWFSKALRGVLKHDPLMNARNKVMNSAGLGTNNALRLALDPGSVQQEKIAKGASINSGLAFDPGNVVMGAPAKMTPNAPQIDPRTGKAGMNARDAIAMQMGQGGPPMAGAPMQATQPHISAPLPVRQAAPPQNYGDISAIMDYVQGNRAPPQGGAPGALNPMKGLPRMPAPQMLK